jgi:uracil-DNA glycosylase family 4
MTPVEQVLGEARACQLCQADGLLYSGAFPVLHRDPPWPAPMLVVAEATNRGDTFRYGRISVDVVENDPTGRFQRQLFASVGLRPEQLLFTNAVLCLPRQERSKFPVSPVQRTRCATWLRRLIDAADPRVVLTFGATALQALAAVEAHRLVLRESAGQIHPWYGRHVLPLYHPGHYGQLSRSAEKQMEDIAVLRSFLAGIAE